MTLILDAGALLAIERQDRKVNVLIDESDDTITSAAVVAQA